MVHRRGAERCHPLGVAIIGGPLISQVLTLYTTPVIYLMLERLQRKLSRGPSPPLPEPVPPSVRALCTSRGPQTAGALQRIHFMERCSRLSRPRRHIGPLATSAPAKSCTSLVAPELEVTRSLATGSPLVMGGIRGPR